MSNNSKDYLSKFRAKNLDLGRKRKEYYVTDSEHIAIKAKIKSMRGKNEQANK